MGYSKDLGTSTVEKIDAKTGLPADRYGHLLNPVNPYDGNTVPNWDKKGTELANLTSPYGFLSFACGTEDDFYCFDSSVIDTPKGKFCIIHAVRNSETGGFIEGACYHVISIDTEEGKRSALSAAFESVSDGYDFLYAGDEGEEHDKDGWNQDPYYFVADVARMLFGFECADPRYPTVDEVRQMRSLAQ